MHSFPTARTSHCFPAFNYWLNADACTQRHTATLHTHKHYVAPQSIHAVPSAAQCAHSLVDRNRSETSLWCVKWTYLQHSSTIMRQNNGCAWIPCNRRVSRVYAIDLLINNLVIVQSQAHAPTSRAEPTSENFQRIKFQPLRNRIRKSQNAFSYNVCTNVCYKMIENDGNEWMENKNAEWTRIIEKFAHLRIVLWAITQRAVDERRQK